MRKQVNEVICLFDNCHYLYDVTEYGQGRRPAGLRAASLVSANTR